MVAIGSAMVRRDSDGGRSEGMQRVSRGTREGPQSDCRLPVG